MGVLYKLNDRGHGVIGQWDESVASRATIAAVFAEHIDKGDKIADLTNPGGTADGNFVTAFDPDAQTDLLIVPKMVAG